MQANIVANKYTANFKKLGDVCKIINGFFFPKTVLQPGDEQLPYVKTTDMVAVQLTNTNATIPVAVAKKKKAEIASKGAFLIALTGATIGQIVSLDMDAIIDPNLCAVLNEWLEALDNRFLYFFLSVNVPFLINRTKTSNRIQSTLLKDLTIPILPIETQRKLVEEISEKISSIDIEIASLEHQVETAKTEKQLIIDKVFNEDIYDNDSQVNKISLAEIANVQAGNTPTESMSVYYGNDYPFFRPDDIYQGNNMLTSKIQVSIRGAKVARLITPNALLVVTSGLLLGKVGISRVEATCNRSLTAIMPYKNISAAFLYYQFQSKLVQTQIMDEVVKGNITKSKLSTIQCCTMPIDTQINIVEFLQEKIEKIDAIITNAQALINKLTQDKQALLITTFKAK